MNGLPAGFVLDRQPSRSRSVPPLPPGFVIDNDLQEEPAPVMSAAAQPQQGDNFLGYVNQGIAGALGAPVDLVNAGLGMVGLGSEVPFGGSEAISRGLRRVGASVAMPGQNPDSLSDYVGQGVGGAAGMLLPGAAVSSALTRSGSALAQGVGAAISRPFLATPGRALAAEVTAGAGAGAGQSAAANLAPDNPYAQMAGAFIGGGIGGMGPMVARRAIEAAPVTGTALRMAQAEVAPFTQAGATERARRRMGGLSEDRGAALSNMQEPSIGNLSLAARSGDRRLMAMEQAVRDQNPTIDAQMRAQETASGQILREEMRAPAQGQTAQAARDFSEGRTRQLIDAMRARTTQAEQTAQQRLEALTPTQRRSQSSIVVREELEAAQSAARAQERDLWAQVPRDELVPTTGATEAYKRVYDDLARAQRDDIPPVARDLLGADGNQTFRSAETVREVHGLYSALRQEARNSRAGETPNANRARISDELADALLEDMQTVQSASAPLRQALDFSREFNRTFRRGSVGRVLGSERTGGQRVAPEMTLDATIGRSGPQGGANMDELGAALAGRDVQAPMRDYTLDRFQDAATRNGQLRPAQAESFMRSNRDVLDRQPAVRQEIGDAMIARSASDRIAAALTERSARVQNPRQSVAAALLNSKQGDEIQTFLKASDPQRMAAQAARQASRDASGKASLGLKGALIDDLMGSARISNFDDTGQTMVSGRALQARLADPRMEKVAGEILTPDELARTRRVADEFRRIEMMQGRLPSIGDRIMGDEPNSIVAYLARVVAARQGAQLGQGTSGASLQTAQLASTRMKRLLDRLTNDKAEALIKQAITGDEDLFAALLSDGRNMTQKQETRLIETLTGIVGQQAANADIINALMQSEERRP